MESVYIAVGTELLEFIEAIRNPVFDQIFLASTLLGESAFILLAAAIVTLCYKEARWVGAGMVLVFILSSVLNAEIKEMLNVPRPDPGEVDALTIEEGTSTPSAHTMIATSVWLFLAFMLPHGWWRGVLFFVPILVGFSRLYIGVHYPGDVVLGMVLGAAIAVAIHSVMLPRKDSPLTSPAYSLAGYAVIGFVFYDLLH
jgi:membrane-associated phospholipid phosphatase